jgi:hypothetical protein
LDLEMAKFNLQMSLQKTEIMMFRNHGSTHTPPTPVVIRSSTLKEVESFKYLGVQVSQTGSLVDHCSSITQRARVAAHLTSDLLHRLNIIDIARMKLYFLCFVQAQFYGLELLPSAILTQLEQIRNLFMRRIFSLPRGIPSELFFVLFPSYTPSVLCLRRRLAFFRRLLRHNLSCVTTSALVDVVELYSMSCGWMHESFLIYKSVCPAANHSRFDFLEEVSSFQDIISTEEAFSFEYIRNSSSVCMSLFRLVPSSHGLRNFRLSLGKLEHSFQHVILTFSCSQLRWCFFPSPCQTCPLCQKKSWYWEHFLACPLIVPLLSSRRISLIDFCSTVKAGNWPRVFDIIANVLLCWHFALATVPGHRVSQYNPDVFRSLSRRAQELLDLSR